MAKRSPYDNLEKDEALALRLDTAVRYTKKADWIGNRFKEKEVVYAIRQELGDRDFNPEQILSLVKEQGEYK